MSFEDEKKKYLSEDFILSFMVLNAFSTQVYFSASFPKMLPNENAMGSFQFGYFGRAVFSRKHTKCGCQWPRYSLGVGTE